MTIKVFYLWYQLGNNLNWLAIFIILSYSFVNLFEPEPKYGKSKETFKEYKVVMGLNFINYLSNAILLVNYIFSLF